MYITKHEYYNEGDSRAIDTINQKSMSNFRGCVAPSNDGSSLQSSSVLFAPTFGDRTEAGDSFEKRNDTAGKERVCASARADRFNGRIGLDPRDKASSPVKEGSSCSFNSSKGFISTSLLEPSSLSGSSVMARCRLFGVDVGALCPIQT